MLRFNDAMYKHILQTKFASNDLDRGLQDIVSNGFTNLKQCHVLTGLVQDHFHQYEISQFYDETGFEAFINSVHIEDFYNGSGEVSAALHFLLNVFIKWNENSSDTLVASYSISDEANHVVKFYLSRPGQAYLNDDLEGYVQEILEVMSSDIDSLKALVGAG